MRLTVLLLNVSIALYCSSGEAIRIDCDWNRTHQTIVGFGGSMGWIHPLPEQRNEIFELLFKDLGATVLRVQTLGGENGDESTPEPENDNGDANAFEWKKILIKEQEAKGAATIKDAQSRGVKTIIPVTWSPPGWMKNTGRRAGTGGEFRAEFADELAELWTAYVIGMKRDFDITISNISIQNEPDLTYYYPTCRYEPDVYAKAMAAVIKRLQKEKLDVRVLGPDTCRIYNLEKYAAAMEKEKIPAGWPLLTHLYDLGIPFEHAEKDAERWRAARELAVKSRRPLWLMETANYLGGLEQASFAEALIWAQKIHWALTEGHCEVVCYWSLFFDKKGEALIYFKPEMKKYEITPKFYTSKNFYRFVRPGMTRCEAASSAKHVLASAFKDADNRVIVLINTSKDDALVNCPVLAEGAWERHVTARSQNCVKLENVRDTGQVTLPAESVITLVCGKQ